MSTSKNLEPIDHIPSKRRRVASTERKRVAKACSSCRRLKEKCDGWDDSNPCSRCIRYGRLCEGVPTIMGIESNVEARVGHLEAIARHFLGDIALDCESLERIVNNLRPRRDDKETHSGTETSQPGANDHVSIMKDSSQHLSDAGFAKQIYHEVNHHLQATGIPMTDVMSQEYTPNSWSLFHRPFNRAQLPPKDVALFLSGAYFQFTQTNDIWIERSWSDAALEQLYDFDQILTNEDGPCICSILLVFAMGSQVAYLASRASDDAGSGSTDRTTADFDNETSIKFYRMAADLLPDTIILPCVNSAQALAMFAHFALSWSMIGPALRYLEAAKATITAISGEQECYESKSSPDTLLKSRIWHVASCWTKRLKILNGYSMSTESRLTVTSALASSFTANEKLGTQSTIYLTSWLSAFDQYLRSLDLSGQALPPGGIQQIMDMRRRYKNWWSSLSISRTPVLQLNRDTACPHLYHHMNLIFLGRPFVFTANTGGNEAGLSTDAMNNLAELVDDAEYSAYEIIDICFTLDKAGGLTASNHLEFNTCKAAMFVMLAQSLAGRCYLFRDKLQQGVDLMRRMTKNVSTSKLSVISIYDDISRLQPHKRNQKYGPKERSCVNPKRGYDCLREWVNVDADVFTTHDLAFDGILNDNMFDIGTIDFGEISRSFGSD